MKRWFFLALFILFMIANRSETPQPETVKTEKKSDVITPVPSSKPVTQYQSQKFPSVPSTKDRSPANAPQTTHKISRSLSSLARPENIRVGKSFQVLEGVLGLKKDLYKPELGQKVSEDKYFVYFKSEVMQPEAYPVALNAGSQKIYPLSPILHIKGADEALRTQLKAEGMDEFYYNSRMKLLSVESSPSLVLSQYQALLKRGLDVRLEVLKEGPKSR